MAAFEYLVESIIPEIANGELKDYLDGQGREGWELVSVVHQAASKVERFSGHASTTWIAPCEKFYFKRRIGNPV